ncbi:MAG: radical SAM protein [Magnetococcales bacterium]|nr:radical SAM protein [Magnetococcales bacterium]MBF0347670.1 radical SAM protein [Magnetococcales bacterium]MBF0631246.1 radical SAM protein [Magnetococcales bacterium]
MRNRLRLAARIFRDNFSEPTRPYKLTFAATGRCNSRCRSCGSWRHESVDELKLEEIERFFVVNHRFQWLDFTGGEYFLRDDAVEIARIALRHNRHCFHFHVPTNAVEPERTVAGVRQLIRHAPDLFTLTLSLDGPPALHDRIRGIPGNWDSVMTVYRELEGLQTASFRIFFGFTLNPWNLGHFSSAVMAVQQRFPKVTIRHFHMNVMHRSSHYYRTEGASPVFVGRDQELLAEVERFRRGIRRRLDPIAVLEHRYLARIKTYLDTHRSPLPCQAMAGSLFLAADGTVYPCSIWDRPLGNLRRDGFDMQPLLAAAGEVRQTIRAERCPGCWTPCEAYPSILAAFLHPRHLFS